EQARWNDRRVEDICLRRRTSAAVAADRHIELSTEWLTACWCLISRIQHASWRQGEQGQSAISGWSKVTVDVDDQIRIVGDKHGDVPVRSGRHNGGIRCD